MSTISNIGAKKWANTIRDIQKKSYWVIGLLLLGFSAYFYYTSLNRPVAGVLWFLGGFLIWYYYWVKWFVMDQPLDPDFLNGASACPDYLSVIPSNSGLYRPTSKTQYFCVDFVGVSRNGGLRKMNRNNIKTEISKPSYRFSVDPEVDFVNAASKAAFMRRLNAAGLSYNSVGDNSLPTMGGHSNGAPTFSTVVPPMPSGLVATTGSTGMPGGASSNTTQNPFAAAAASAPTLTFEQIKGVFQAIKAAGVAPNSMPVDSQVKVIMANLNSKGLVPAGTEFGSIFLSLGKSIQLLTPAQQVQLQSLM